MNVLVTGGAGYIGSHAVSALAGRGHRPIVLDHFGRGHCAAVPDGVDLWELDLADADPMDLAQRLTGAGVEAVLHFAALAYVGESVREPLRYFRANVVGSLNLLRAMGEAGVDRLVFSSTCATYGQPPAEQIPIRETTPQTPINPYGRSKLMVEHIIADHAATRPGFAHARLRYFNVVGCAADGTLGEDHRPETHLVPLAIRAALGQGPLLTVFGEDYPTPDGTCVRDYIHVEDLIDAHLLTLDALADGDARVYNLGTGRGHSVREVLAAVQEVVGKAVPHTTGPRRVGDPPTLFADASKIRDELGWAPRLPDLIDAIRPAVDWFVRHPQGYASRSSPQL